MIDLQRLEAFLFAAETSSFSEAAKHLHVTQPTISHHIKGLEQDLGVELFSRSGRHIKLTEGGRLLLPWARRLMRQSIEIEDMMTSLQQMAVGHLRIACSTTAGKYILPQLAARFRTQCPGVHVSILSCTSEYIIPRLLEGEANLGVVSHEIPTEEGLEYQAFFEDCITLIVPKDHPWTRLPSVGPEALLEEPFIIREPTAGTRRVMLAELAKFDITLDDLNVFLELGNAEAIVRTVADGFGISFVSELAAECAVYRGDVAVVPVEGIELRRWAYMVRRMFDVPYRPQEMFWEFIHDPENKDLIGMAQLH